MNLSMQRILCAAALLAGCSVANAAVVTVGPSGTHATLSAAITAANDGDTVRFVDGGTYAPVSSLPANKTLIIDVDPLVTPGTVIISGTASMQNAATGGNPFNMTFRDLVIQRSDGGTAVVVRQGSGPVSFTFENCTISASTAETFQINGGVGVAPPPAPVTVTVTGGTINNTAASGTLSCFRIASGSTPVDGLTAGAMPNSTVTLNNVSMTAFYGGVRITNSNTSIVNLNGCTLTSTAVASTGNASSFRVENSTGSTFNITNCVFNSHDAAVQEAAGTNNVFNITGSRMSTTRPNGTASAIRSAGTANGSIYNIQRCSLSANSSARPLNFGVSALPSPAQSVNIYNTVITGADTQQGVNVNGTDLRMWNCTVAGFGGTPTAAAVRVETGGGTGRTLDVRNCLLTGYASMINPDATDNSLTDYNFISAADADAGPNRVTNTSETLTFNSTNIMDSSHFVPNVPSIGGTPMGTASAALVTGNAALLGTDRFGGTRPVPALSNPDMGAVETSFGGPPPTPEMEVFDGVTLLSNGATIDLGNVTEGSPTVTRTITVNNVGDATLTITDTQIGGTGYSIDAPLAGTLAALTGTDAVVVQVSTAVVGPTNGTLNIVSDDPTNPNFQINFVLDVDSASREANWMNHD